VEHQLNYDHCSMTKLECLKSTDNINLAKCKIMLLVFWKSNWKVAITNDVNVMFLSLQTLLSLWHVLSKLLL